MFKSAVKALLIFAFATALLAAISPAASAETLSDFQQRAAQYQTEPEKRAADIRDEVRHMKSIEEGLARQNGISVTRVLKYEDICNDLINYYYSIYYLQKHRGNMNKFQLDDAQIRALASSTPPYSFIYYLNAVEDVEACRGEMKRQNEIYDRAKQRSLEAEMAQKDLERQYRIFATRLSDAGSVSSILNWEMQEIKIHLELRMAEKAFYTLSKSLATEDLQTAREKYNTMCSMLANIRNHVTFSNDDFEYLDAFVAEHSRPLVRTVAMLDVKYSKLENLYENTENSSFTKFWLRTEQSLVEDEILILEDMIDNWQSLRLVWRTLQDILEGKLPLDEKKSALQHAHDMTDNVSEITNSCKDQLQTIYRVEQEVQRRFSKEGALSSDDATKRDEFMDNLGSRKLRMLDYIIDNEAVKAQYEQLANEIRLISEGENLETTPTQALNERAVGFMQFEIWHIGDFPLTVGRLLHSLATFLLITVITQAICYYVKRRAAKRINPHGALLLRKLIAYTGFIIAALCALLSLRIPLTAFAFFGGAIAIAFGFGAQKIMGDVFGGIMLLFQKKLRVGDEVIIDGQRGIVTEITLQDTVLLCEQSKYLIIPNSRVQDSPLVNLTLGNPATRTEFSVGIAYGSDMERAMGIIRGILSEDRDVLKSPPFKILMEEFGDSSVILTAQFFVNIEKCIERDVKSRMRQNILEAFAAAGISIPFPQSDVRIISSDK